MEKNIKKEEAWMSMAEVVGNAINGADEPVDEFQYSGKELESDKGVKALYQRWMTHYGIHRTITDQKARFNTFKAKAKLIYSLNHKYGLNEFADMTLSEFHTNTEFPIETYLGMDFVPAFVQDFEYSQKDFESHKTLWALYQRWMKHHGLYRTRSEQEARFNQFKQNAMIYYHNSNSTSTVFKCRLLNVFWDTPDEEFLDALTAFMNETALRKCCQENVISFSS